MEILGKNVSGKECVRSWLWEERRDLSGDGVEFTALEASWCFRKEGGKMRAQWVNPWNGLEWGS